MLVIINGIEHIMVRSALPYDTIVCLSGKPVSETATYIVGYCYPHINQSGQLKKDQVIMLEDQLVLTVEMYVVGSDNGEK